MLTLKALGGLGETGALNCMLYDTGRTAILVDCGVAFPDDSLPGVNLMHPDFSRLEQVRDRLQAVVLTHGHEDHMGAIAFFLKKFPVAVYATRFTCGLVRQKLEELAVRGISIHEMAYDAVVTIGEFSIDPLFVNHSIIDAAALYIRYKEHSVMHLTDFKIDHSAPEGRVIDLARFRAIGDEGLDLLLSDSTNAFSEGWTVSETRVRSNLIERFTKLKGRILACLFSSNIHRVQSLVECARVSGRSLAFTGRSAKEYTRLAREQGRLDLKGVDVRDVEDLAGLADEQVMVIVTGSQAEARSVLNRISQDMFRPFKLREGDTVLMSSRIIPGNEGNVLRMLNDLALRGAHIEADSYEHPIHTSGHARQEELREVIRLLKPKNFIPIHGEFSHLKKHAELAVEMGMPKTHVHMALDGQAICLSDAGVTVAELVEEQSPGRIYISESGDIPITGGAIKRRKKMAWNGLVAVSVVIDGKNGILPQVALRTEGLFGGALEEENEEKLQDMLYDILQERAPQTHEIEKFFKVEIRHFFKARYNLRPEVMVLVHEL